MRTVCCRACTSGCAPRSQRRYGERLEQLYADLERKQNEELMALQDPRQRAERARQGRQGARGRRSACRTSTSTQPFSFTDLGGDSLGAHGLRRAAPDIFGVACRSTRSSARPATAAVGAGHRSRAGARSRARTPTFATVHGKGARQISAKDLDIDAFIDADTLSSTRRCAPPPEVSPHRPADRARPGSSAASCAWNGWSGWPPPAAR